LDQSLFGIDQGLDIFRHDHHIDAQKSCEGRSIRQDPGFNLANRDAD
jgi:hypothetical protein